MGTQFTFSGAHVSKKSFTIAGALPQLNQTMNDYFRKVHLVPLVLHGLLGSRAQSLIVRVLGHILMSANHLFTSFNSDDPFGLVRIPRDLHTFRTHGLLHP